MGLKQHINELVNNVDSKRGKVFALGTQGLIILSLIAFSVSTLPGLSPATENILWLIEFVTVVLFTAEYLLRLFVSDPKHRFIFSFFGLIDLLAILPFYISTGMDLRSLRLFRLFRLIRILKIVRYNKAIRTFNKALIIAKEELILFSMIAVILLYVSAVGIYHFEHHAQPEAFKSIFHSLWWSVATLTTVGYGDAYPITAGGRIFTFFILMIGLGLVAVPTGIVSSALTNAVKDGPSNSEENNNGEL